MISLKEGFIFIHVPKTAGTSIKKYLAGYDLRKKWTPDPNEILYLYSHMTACQLRSALKKHDSSIREGCFFQFAFVRNPWERALSAFRYLARGGSGTQWDVKIASLLKIFNLSFMSFVKYGLLHLGEKIPHFYPQYYWTHKDLGNMPLDYIGRYENLTNDLENIMAIIRPEQVMGTTPLPWLRKSDHDHYSCYYDDETKDLVARFYREDIRLLGYEFEKA